MDGPVARAAHAALDTGNVNVALIWVDEEDETELRQAFASAQAVRKLSADAQHLADRYFGETLARMHCLEQRSPYLGPQPAQLELSAYEYVKSYNELLQRTFAIYRAAAESCGTARRSARFGAADLEAGMTSWRKIR